MVVSSPQIPFVKANTPQEVHAKIFYFNDLHGMLSGTSRIKTEADTFELQNKTPGVDTFKFCAGDTFIGSDLPKNQFMAAALNLIKPDGSVLGNHPFDLGTKKLFQVLDKCKIPFIVTNLNYKQNSNITQLYQQNKLVRSTIIEKNGNKYGIIGSLPTDFMRRVNEEAKKEITDISIDSEEETLKELQQEIDTLKAQGINKIILISHRGYEADVQAAKALKGVDIIIGGHTHNLIQGVTSGKNWVLSASGEPVIITQAEKDGNYSGLLDVVFDNKGIIKGVSNQVKKTKDTPKNLLVRYIENKLLGPAQQIGIWANDCDKIEENELGTSPIILLLGEAVKAKSKAQIVFNNMGGIKGGIKAGVITDRDIKEINPYFNKVTLYKLSEKDVIEALNGSIKATLNVGRIGNLQTTGLEYTIGKDKKVKDVYLIKEDGTKEKLNSETPSNTKTFEVAYGSYLAGGPEYIEGLKCPEKAVKAFDWTETDAFIDYIKSKNNQPIELKPSRIKIEN